MATLPEETTMYCDRRKEDVPCRLVRHQELSTRMDAYRCTRMGTGDGSPCNPCLHYSNGIFVPMPVEARNPDGSMDPEKWADALHVTVEVPLSSRG